MQPERKKVGVLSKVQNLKFRIGGRGPSSGLTGLGPQRAVGPWGCTEVK